MSKAVKQSPTVKNEKLKSLQLAVCLALSSAPAGLVFANPVGGVVQAGSATISGNGNVLDINQSTDKAIIDWQDFSVEKGETTRFIQPSSSSSTLNRVVGDNLSRIHGSIESTGEVILLNQNGITFGKDGRVNAAGGFLGSTLEMSNDDFMNGGDRMLSGAGGKIDNKGRIYSSGGDVFLAGGKVSNSGHVTAKGHAGLAAGKRVLIRKQSGPNGRISVQIGAKGITNSGTIQGASAELKALGGNVGGLAINSSGTIRATGTKTQGGRVFLSGGATGDVRISGRVIANSARNAAVALAARKAANAKRGAEIKAAQAAARAKHAATIKITGRHVTVTKTAQIQANNNRTQGNTNAGRVHIQASRSINVQGQIQAKSAHGKGGRVTIHAKKVTIGAGARINASGATAGGQIHIGADASKSGFSKNELSAVNQLLNGGGAAATKSSVVVNPGAKIVADATKSGKGGTVSIKADSTRVSKSAISIKGVDGSGSFSINDEKVKQRLAKTEVVEETEEEKKKRLEKERLEAEAKAKAEAEAAAQAEADQKAADESSSEQDSATSESSAETSGSEGSAEDATTTSSSTEAKTEDSSEASTETVTDTEAVKEAIKTVAEEAETEEVNAEERLTETSADASPGDDDKEVEASDDTLKSDDDLEVESDSTEAIGDEPEAGSSEEAEAETVSAVAVEETFTIGSGGSITIINNAATVFASGTDINNNQIDDAYEAEFTGGTDADGDYIDDLFELDSEANTLINSNGVYSDAYISQILGTHNDVVVDASNDDANVIFDTTTGALDLRWDTGSSLAFNAGNNIETVAAPVTDTTVDTAPAEVNIISSIGEAPEGETSLPLGLISFFAGNSVILGESGATEVIVNIGSEAGDVEVSATNDVALDNVNIDVSTTEGTGGTVKVEAENIEIAGDSTIDASGSTGGGQINVGGGFQGNDANHDNSQTVSIGSGVELKVDSTESNDAGDAVVWSDGTTTFEGTVSAQALGDSGDGGQVEVSGKETLHFAGSVNTLAENGKAGDLLLDPAAVLIVDGDKTGVIGTDSTLHDAQIAEMLKTTNVTIDATGAITIAPTGIDLVGDGTGDANGDVDIIWDSATKLTLNAGGAIIVDNTFGDVTIQHRESYKDTDANGDGVLDPTVLDGTGNPDPAAANEGIVDAGDTFVTGNGGVELIAGAAVTIGNAVTGTGDIAIGSEFGDTTVRAAGLVTVSGSLAGGSAQLGYRIVDGSREGYSGIDADGNISHAKNGDITVTANAGGVLVTGGLEALIPVGNGFAQIGHGGKAYNANVSDYDIADSKITINAGALGVVVEGGAAENKFAQIGHGIYAESDNVNTDGRIGQGDISGDIEINVTAGVGLAVGVLPHVPGINIQHNQKLSQVGHGSHLFYKGHGDADATTAEVYQGRISGDITVDAPAAPVTVGGIQAGTVINDRYTVLSQLGHGTYTRISHSDDIGQEETAIQVNLGQIANFKDITGEQTRGYSRTGTNTALIPTDHDAVAGGIAGFTIDPDKILSYVVDSKGDFVKDENGNFYTVAERQIDDGTGTGTTVTEYRYYSVDAYGNFLKEDGTAAASAADLHYTDKENDNQDLNNNLISAALTHVNSRAYIAETIVGDEGESGTDININTSTLTLTALEITDNSAPLSGDVVDNLVRTQVGHGSFTRMQAVSGGTGASIPDQAAFDTAKTNVDAAKADVVPLQTDYDNAKDVEDAALAAEEAPQAAVDDAAIALADKEGAKSTADADLVAANKAKADNTDPANDAALQQAVDDAQAEVDAKQLAVDDATTVKNDADTALADAKAITAPATTDREVAQTALEAGVDAVGTASTALAATVSPGLPGLPISANNGKTDIEITEGDISGNINVDASAAVLMTSGITAGLIPVTNDVMSTRIGHATANLIQNVNAASGATKGETWDAGDITINQANIIGANIEIQTLAFAQTTAIAAGLAPVVGNTALTRVGHGGEAILETGDGASGADGEDSTFGGDIIVNLGSIWDGVVENTKTDGTGDGSYYGNELNSATDSGVDITIESASGESIVSFTQTSATTAALSPAIANNSQSEVGHGQLVWASTGNGGGASNPKAASGGRAGDIDIDQRTRAVQEQEGSVTGYDVANGIRGDIAVDTIAFAQTVINTAALSPATHNTNIATIGHGVDMELETGNGLIGLGLGASTGGDANGKAKVADGGRGGDITVALGDAYLQGDIDVDVFGPAGTLITATSVNALSPVIENMLDAGIGHDPRIFAHAGDGAVAGSGDALTSAQGGRGGDIHIEHNQIADRSQFGTGITENTITIGDKAVTTLTATGGANTGDSDITVFSVGAAGMVISSMVTDALTQGIGDDLYTGIGHHVRLAGEGGIGADGGSASDAFDDSDVLTAKYENFVVGQDATTGADIVVSLLDRYERDIDNNGTGELYVKVIRENGTGKVISYKDENDRTVVNVIRDSSGNIIGYSDEYDNSVAMGANGTYVDNYQRTINATHDAYGLVTTGNMSVEDTTGQNGNGEQAILNDEKFQAIFLRNGQSADVQPDVTGGRGGDVTLSNGDITGDIIVDSTGAAGITILTGTGNAGDSKIIAGIGHSTDLLAVVQQAGNGGTLSAADGGIKAHDIESAFKIRLLDGNDDDTFDIAKDGNNTNYDTIGLLVDDEDGSDNTNISGDSAISDGEHKALTLAEMFSENTVAKNVTGNAANGDEITNGRGQGVDLNVDHYDDRGTADLTDDLVNQDIRKAGVNPNATTVGRNATLTASTEGAGLFATDEQNITNQAVNEVNKAIMIYDVNGNPQFIKVVDHNDGDKVFYLANTADNRAIVAQNTENAATAGTSRYDIHVDDTDKEAFSINSYSTGGTTDVEQFRFDDSYARDTSGNLIVNGRNLQSADQIKRSWTLNQDYDYTQDTDRKTIYADLDDINSTGNIDLVDRNADGKFDVIDVDQDGKLDLLDGRASHFTDHASTDGTTQTDQLPDYEVVTGKAYDAGHLQGGYEVSDFSRADGGRGGDGEGKVGTTTGDVWVDSHLGTIIVSNSLIDTNVTSTSMPNDYHEARIGHGSVQIIDGVGHSIVPGTTRNVAGRMGLIPVLTPADGGDAGTGAIIANGGRGGDMTSILGNANADAGNELDHVVGDIHINDAKRYALVDKNGAYVYDKDGKMIERDIRFVGESAERQADIRQRFADDLQSKTGAVGSEYTDGNDLQGIGDIISVDRDSKGNVIQYAIDANGDYVQVRLNGDINVLDDNDNEIWRASDTNYWNADSSVDINGNIIDGSANGNETLRTDDDNTIVGDVVLDKIIDANGNAVGDDYTGGRKVVLDRYIDDWELRKLDRDGIGGYDNVGILKPLDANADGVPDNLRDTNTANTADDDGALDSYSTYDVNGDNTADSLIPHPTIANAYVIDTDGDGIADSVNVDGKGAVAAAGDDGIGYVFYKDDNAPGGYIGVVNYGDDDNVANNYDLEAGQDIVGKVDKVNVRHLEESELITLNRNSSSGVLNDNDNGTDQAPDEIKGRVTFSGSGKIQNADNRVAVKASNPDSTDLFYDEDGNLVTVDGDLAWKAIYQTTDAGGLVVDSSDKMPNLGKSLEFFSEATARVGHGGRSIALGGNGGNGAVGDITEIANGGRAGDVNSDSQQLKGEITVRTGGTAGITLNTSNVPGLGSIEDQDVFVAQIGHGHYNTVATNKGGDGADGQQEGNGGRGGDATSRIRGAIDADILIDTHTFSTGPATVSLTALNLVGGENIMRTMIGHGDINMASTATVAQNALGNWQNTQYLMNGQGGAGAASDDTADQINGEANGGRGGDAVAISEGYVGDVTMNLAPGLAPGVVGLLGTVPGVASIGPALVITSVVGNVLPVDTPLPRNHILASIGHGGYSTADSGKGGDASLVSASIDGVDRNGGRGGDAISVIADNGTGRNVDNRENLDHGVNDTDGSDLTINLYDATLGSLSPDVHDLDDHVENQRINDVTNIGTDIAADSSNIKTNEGSLQVGDVNLQIGNLTDKYDTRYQVNRNRDTISNYNYPNSIDQFGNAADNTGTSTSPSNSGTNGTEEEVYDINDPRYAYVLQNEKVELAVATYNGDATDLNQNIEIEHEDRQDSQIELVEDNGTAQKGADSEVRGDLPTNNGDENNLYAERDNQAGVTTYDFDLDGQATDPANGGGSSKTNGAATGSGFDGILISALTGFGDNSLMSESNAVGRSVDNTTALIGHHGFNRADATSANGGAVLGGKEAATANGGDGGDAVARTGQINGDIDISNTVYLDELHEKVELLLKTENILNDETYREVARLAGVDTETTADGHLRLKDDFNIDLLINRDSNGEYADANNDIDSQGQLIENFDRVLALIKADEHVVDRYADTSDLGGANDPYSERAGHRYVEVRNTILDRLIDRAKVDNEDLTAASVTLISSSDGATVIPEDDLNRADARIGHQVANEAIAQNVGGATLATATVSAQGGDSGDAKGLQGRVTGDIDIHAEGSIDVLTLNAGAQSIQGVNVATIGHRQENDVRAANILLGGTGGKGGKINDDGVAGAGTNWQVGDANVENAQSQKATDEQTAVSGVSLDITTSKVVPDTTLESIYQSLLEFKTYKDGGDSNAEAWNKLSVAEKELIEFITGDPTRQDTAAVNYADDDLLANAQHTQLGFDSDETNGRIEIVDRAIFDPNTKDVTGQTRGDLLDDANHRGYFQNKSADLDVFLDRLVVGTRDTDEKTRNVTDLNDDTLNGGAASAAKESIKAIMAAGGDGGDAISDQQGASGNITLSALGQAPSLLGALAPAITLGGKGINIVAQSTAAQSALNSAFSGVGHEQEVVKAVSGKAGVGDSSVGIGGDGGDALVNQGSIEGEINLFSGDQIQVKTFIIGAQNPEVQIEARVGHRQEIGTQRNTRHLAPLVPDDPTIRSGVGATGYANGNGGDILVTQNKIDGDINLKTNDYLDLVDGKVEAGSIRVVTSIVEAQSALIQGETHVGHEFLIHSAKAGDAGTGSGLGLAGVTEGNGGDIYLTQGTDGVAVAGGITLEAEKSTIVATNVVNAQSPIILARTLIGHESTAGEEWGGLVAPFDINSKITAGNGGDTTPEKSNVTTHEDADGGNITASFGAIKGDITGRALEGNVTVVTNTLGGTNGITFGQTELGHQRRFTAVSGDADIATAGDGGNIDIGRGEISGDILLEALGQVDGTNAVIVNTLNTVGAGVPTYATTLVGHGEFMDITTGVSGVGKVDGSEGDLIAILEKVEDNTTDARDATDPRGAAVAEGGINDAIKDAAAGIAGIVGGVVDTINTGVIGVAAGDDLDPYEVTEQEAIDRITARIEAEEAAAGNVDQADIDAKVAAAINAEVNRDNDNSITVADANEAYFAMQELLNKVKLAERYPDRLSAEDQQHLAAERAKIEAALATLKTARDTYLTSVATAGVATAEEAFVAASREQAHVVTEAYASAKRAFVAEDRNIFSDHADAGDITYTNNVKLTEHSQNLMLDHEQKGQYVRTMTTGELSTGRVTGDITAHAGQDDFGAFEPKFVANEIVRAELDVDGDLTTSDPYVLGVNEVILDDNGSIIAREGDTVTDTATASVPALAGRIIYNKVPDGIINSTDTLDENDEAYTDAENTGIVSVTAMSAGLPGVIWTETELGHRRTNTNESGENKGGESGNGGDITIANTTLGDVNLKADLVNLEANSTILGVGITELHLGHDVGKNAIEGAGGDVVYAAERLLIHGGLGLGIKNTAGKSAVASKIADGGNITTAQYVGDDPLTTAVEQADINIDTNHLGTLPASSVLLVPLGVAAALDPTGIADAAHRLADDALLAAEALPLLTAGAIGAQTVTLDLGIQAREVSTSNGDGAAEYSNRAGDIDTAQVLNGDINVNLDLDDDGKFKDLTILTVDAGVVSTTNFGHTSVQRAGSGIGIDLDTDIGLPLSTAGDEVKSKQVVKGDINFEKIEDLAIINTSTLLASNSYFGHDAINFAESGAMDSSYGGKVEADQLVDGQINMTASRSVKLSQTSLLAGDLRFGHEAEQTAKSANDKSNDDSSADGALASGNADGDNTTATGTTGIDPVGEFAVQNAVDVDATQRVKGTMSITTGEIIVTNTGAVLPTLRYGHTADHTTTTDENGHVLATTLLGGEGDGGIKWETLDPTNIENNDDTLTDPAAINGNINISQLTLAVGDTHIGHDSTSTVVEGGANKDGSANTTQTIDSKLDFKAYHNMTVIDGGIAGNKTQLGHRIDEAGDLNANPLQVTANYDVTTGEPNTDDTVKSTVIQTTTNEINLTTGDNLAISANLASEILVGNSSPALNFAQIGVSQQTLGGDITLKAGIDTYDGVGNNDADGVIGTAADLAADGTDENDDILLESIAGATVTIGHDHSNKEATANNEVQNATGDIWIEAGGDLHVLALSAGGLSTQIGHKDYNFDDVAPTDAADVSNQSYDLDGNISTVRNRIQGNTTIGASQNTPNEDVNKEKDVMKFDGNTFVNSGYGGKGNADVDGELRFFIPSQENLTIVDTAKFNDSASNADATTARDSDSSNIFAGTGGSDHEHYFELMADTRPYTDAKIGDGNFTFYFEPRPIPPVFIGTSTPVDPKVDPVDPKVDPVDPKVDPVDPKVDPVEPTLVIQVIEKGYVNVVLHTAISNIDEVLFSDSQYHPSNYDLFSAEDGYGEGFMASVADSLLAAFGTVGSASGDAAKFASYDNLKDAFKKTFGRSIEDFDTEAKRAAIREEEKKKRILAEAKAAGNSAKTGLKTSDGSDVKGEGADGASGAIGDAGDVGAEILSATSVASIPDLFASVNTPDGLDLGTGNAVIATPSKSKAKAKVEEAVPTQKAGGKVKNFLKSLFNRS